MAARCLREVETFALTIKWYLEIVEIQNFEEAKRFVSNLAETGAGTDP